jgi:hypothetical protein
MEAFVNFISEKFGIDREKATAIATQLQAKGKDLPELMKDGISIQELQGLLGDNKELLAGIPGVGGMLGSLMGGQAVVDVPAEKKEPVDPMSLLGKDPR